MTNVFRVSESTDINLKLASIFGENFKRLKRNGNSRFVFRQVICNLLAKKPREVQQKSTFSELNLKLDRFLIER